MSLIALGVTGGIGAYKAVEVARGLQQRGHEVVAIMTRGAQNFVGPVTFEAITRRPVITDQWAAGMNSSVEHVALAGSIGLLLVVPATAHTIAKLALGLADDFLSSLALATTAPLMVAPAMNTHMLEHPAVQQNLQILAARGAHIVEPGAGYLACGWVGKGRLAEPDDIVEAAHRLLTPPRSLAGRRVVVSAGPTYEDLDPVRYIGNRSSGKMGIAIAAEAARRGAVVTLVLGPTSTEPPAELDIVRVRSAADMHAAVLGASEAADVVVMAAAVADYTPASVEGEKIKKGDADLSLRLVRTPDILRELGARRGEAAWPVLVGFAAETSDVVARAREKLAAKRVDLIVANDVARRDIGFEADANEVTFVTAEGDEPLPLAAKTSVAASLWDRVERLMASRPLPAAAS